MYKLDFLEWRIKYDGILSARKLLTQLLATDPENLELHMSMIEYEKLQIPIDLDMIRNLFRIVCLKFCRQGNNVGEYELIFNIIINTTLIIHYMQNYRIYTIESKYSVSMYIYIVSSRLY